MIIHDEWKGKVEKYIKRGDLKDIAKELEISNSLVSQVYRGELNRPYVISAIIKKAEERKQQEIDLLKRVESL